MRPIEDEGRGPPPLTLGDGRFGADRTLRPWTWRLGVFLRALAGVELAKGLVHWAMLIFAGGAAEPLAGLPVSWIAATAFFAVVDPVAALGLWVRAGWGVAVWLIAALGQLIVCALAGPDGGGWAIIAVTMAAMAVYAWLSIKARGEAT